MRSSDDDDDVDNDNNSEEVKQTTWEQLYSHIYLQVLQNRKLVKINNYLYAPQHPRVHNVRITLYSLTAKF